MKNRFLFLFFACIFFLSAGKAQSTEEAVSQRQERLGGYLKLSGGVYGERLDDPVAAESLWRFFRENRFSATKEGPYRRAKAVSLKQTEAIDRVPEGAIDAYRIWIGSSTIGFEYTSARAAAMAVQAFEDFAEKHRMEFRRLKRLPCYDIRGWRTGRNGGTFRWTEPESVVPPDASAVEMRLTDPVKGWIGAGAVLKAVGYNEPLYSGASVTYADIEETNRQLVAEGIDVYPVFDLSGTNERFEQVVGHPMLSVEGMRFVRMLLEAYFTETSFGSVGFVVPEGRYREQIREIVARYPQITDLRISDQ